MIDAGVELTGTFAALDGITAASRSVLRPAAQAGAQVFQRVVQEHVPMSAKPHKSGKKIYTPGNLRRSVYQAHADAESSPTEQVYRVSWNKKNAFYGAFLEYGTSKMAAQPFLRPAYDAALPSALQACSAVMTFLQADLDQLGGA